MTYYAHYHVTYDEPNDVWPRGAWSVYNITGDEIAARIVRDAKGKVVERHPWCGYIGMWTTLDAVQGVIERHKRWVDYANARLAAGHHSVTSFDHWDGQ